MGQEAISKRTKVLLGGGMKECGFGNYRLRVDSDNAPQVSYDDGKSWENIDITEAVENIRLEMSGTLIKSFNVGVPSWIEFSGQDATKWE